MVNMSGNKKKENYNLVKKKKINNQQNALERETKDE